MVLQHTINTKQELIKLKVAQLQQLQQILHQETLILHKETEGTTSAVPDLKR